jgi:hypothetical protein
MALFLLAFQQVVAILSLMALRTSATTPLMAELLDALPALTRQHFQQTLILILLSYATVQKAAILWAAITNFSLATTM